MSPSTPRLPLVLMAILAGLAAPLEAAQGPFQPGMRWIDGASLLAPWIPTRVTFAADDNLVWVGAGVGGDRLLAYDVPGTGVATPAQLDLALGAGVDLIDVAAGGGADRLYALTQRNNPDIFHRVTEVSRRDLLQAAAGGPFTPTWTHDLGFSANGPARFCASALGTVVVAAAWDDQAGLVRVDRLDGATGVLLARTDLAATSLDELCLSADGERLALIVGTRLLVLRSDGQAIHDQSLARAPASLALDADGSRLVVGAVGKVRVLDWTAGAYVEVSSRSGPSNEIAAHVGISPLGETYAVAWWRFTSRDFLRHEVIDGASHGLVLSDVQAGLANGLQNAPVGVALSEDGQRVAFAAWGKADAAPEVVLYDTSTQSTVMAIDLPGSAMAIDLDRSGTRIAVVTKNLHANLFSTTGEVRMYDTGERDLTLLAATRLGGALTAASRKPGASSTLFLVGLPSSAPATVPGALGHLNLVRDGRLYAFARPTDLVGEALLSLPIPGAAALIGAPYSLQAATRVGGQIVLSESTVELLFH